VAGTAAAVGVVAAALVWVVEVEVAHPTSAAATIPTATMRPTVDITVVLLPATGLTYLTRASPR